MHNEDECWKGMSEREMEIKTRIIKKNYKYKMFPIEYLIIVALK